MTGLKSSVPKTAFDKLKLFIRLMPIAVLMTVYPEVSLSQPDTPLGLLVKVLESNDTVSALGFAREIDPVNTADPNGLSSLMYAAEAGYQEVCRILISRGANIDIRSNDGATALILASQNGHSDIVSLLLDKGADPDAREYVFKTTALMQASDITALLLDKGARPDHIRSDGISSLMKASQYGRTEVVKLLLERGAGPDLQSSNGFTALMAASMNGHADIVKLLLENGSNRMLRRDDGATASDLASRNGQTEIVKLLDAGVEK